MKLLVEPFNTTPPRIAPVPEGVHRPQWSVMIPTYNCAKYLRQTLESVLGQDPGSNQMQIEVIDDCSTLDDPEAVVRELGNGRVTFYRKSKNEGAIANFNTCIERSKGHLIHILHGDDWVGPGFYSCIEALSKLHPSKALLAARTFYVNESGEITGITPLIKQESDDSIALESFRDENPIQFAGIVIRRTFYEAQGGFLPALVHTADREMWCRGVALGGGVITNNVYGHYRLFESNDTGRLARTAENLRDHQRLFEILSKRIPNFSQKTANQILLGKAASQSALFRSTGDMVAAKANEYFWRENASLVDWIDRILRAVMRRLS